jgi:hypothetical protein
LYPTAAIASIFTKKKKKKKFSQVLHPETTVNGLPRPGGLADLRLGTTQRELRAFLFIYLFFFLVCAAFLLLLFGRGCKRLW